MYSKLRTQNSLQFGGQAELRTIDEIVAKTKQDTENRKQNVSLDALKKAISNGDHRSFINAIKNPRQGNVAIIAEIKFASPLHHYLGSSDSLITRVKQYEKADVDAISVVTETHFFKGDPSYVLKIKKETSLPVLQKDFVIDGYQLYEAKIAGSDAILLIAKILTEKDIISLEKIARKIGIETVVEISNEDDLKKAVETGTKIIAVNARNLDTFKVDIDRACDLLMKIPHYFIKLGFSGVAGREEVERYKNAGAKGVLIGTSLMRADNIGKFIEGVVV